jgi:hypothetical protein
MLMRRFRWDGIWRVGDYGIASEGVKCRHGRFVGLVSTFEEGFSNVVTPTGELPSPPMVTPHGHIAVGIMCVASPASPNPSECAPSNPPAVYPNKGTSAEIRNIVLAS